MRRITFGVRWTMSNVLISVGDVGCRQGDGVLNNVTTPPYTQCRFL